MVKKAAVFSGCLWLVLSSVEYLFDTAFSRGTFYKQQWVNSFQNESFDLVILGSSRSLTTIDTGAIQEKSGLRVVNLSLDGSSPFDQLCLLKLFLENGNTFKQILLQVDHWVPDSEGPSVHTRRFFHPFRDRVSLQPVLSRTNSDESWAQAAIGDLPMIGYAKWNAYWSVDKLFNSVFNFQAPPFDHFGSYLVDRSLDPQKSRTTSVPKNTKLNLNVIDEILSVCQKERIVVHMFTAPWLNRTSKGSWNEMRDQFKSRCSRYHDFGDLYQNQDDLFYDGGHLNQRGAVLFTDELINLIGYSSV